MKEVDIVAIGNKRLITPAGRLWDSWFDEAVATDDFMVDCEQPKHQVRDVF